MPAYKYTHMNKRKHFIHSEENIFGCCVTPWRSKNVLLTTFGPKKPHLQKPKKPLEPLDLLATVGQSRVCVSVSVLVSVCVCVWRRTTLRRCDVEVSEKNHFSLSSNITLSISNKQTIPLSLAITIITTK